MAALLTKEVAGGMFPGARLVEVFDSDDTRETVVVLAYSDSLQQSQPLSVGLSRRIRELDELRRNHDEALRTAAKEAQLRALDEYRSRMTREPRCQRANDEAMIAAARVLAELRAAIERGEDV